jgi:multidrug efflux pump subunit AcrA (membrane-fusion protein)
MGKSFFVSTKAALMTAALAALAAMAACSSDATEPAPAVPVQMVVVEKSAMQEKITADAVLFPVAQAAIPAKISAPVKKFLVNRGSHVRAGQLLAVLENRDLAAAAQENKGAYQQAEGQSIIATSDLPQAMQKAQLDAQAAKPALEAQQRVFDSRRDLVTKGALPRTELIRPAWI